MIDINLKRKVGDRMWEMIFYFRELWNAFHTPEESVKFEPRIDWWARKVIGDEEYFNSQVCILTEWCDMYETFRSCADVYWPDSKLCMDENNIPTVKGFDYRTWCRECFGKEYEEVEMELIDGLLNNTHARHGDMGHLI